MKKNKFIYKIVFGIMLAIGLFFNSDKVMAKTCVYDFIFDVNKTKQETDTRIIFDVLDDGSMEIRNSNIGLRENIYGTNSPVYYIEKFTISKSAAKKLNENGYLSSTFRLTDSEITAALENGFTPKFYLDDAGNCPKIEFAKDGAITGGTKLFPMPSYIDCKGHSKIWSYANNGSYDNSCYSSVSIGVTDFTALKLCSDSEISSAKQKILDKSDALQMKYKNSSLQATKSKISDFYGYAMHTSQTQCENSSKKALNFIENGDYDAFFDNYIKNSNYYNELDNLVKNFEKPNCPYDEEEFDTIFVGIKNGIEGLIKGWKIDFKTEINNYIDAKNAECISKIVEGNVKEEIVISDEDEKAMEEAIDKSLDEFAEDAANTYGEVVKKYSRYSGINLGDDVEATCDAILGQDLIDLISKLYGYVKMAAPILLLVLGTVDFGTAVISQDKDALEKAFKKFIKRAIICAAIFFIPIILNWLLSKVVIGGTPLMENPMCGIK